MFVRKLAESLTSTHKSILLLGPRQVGKSTLIKSLKPEYSINLANQNVFLQFARNPAELEQRLRASPGIRTVFIDEIQRLPSLLNTIQSIIDDWDRPPRFYLTGSSARKLRKAKANWLPGRVLVQFLGPLVCAEYGDRDVRDLLTYGTLPEILSTKNHIQNKKLLRSYSAIYLKEEIQTEASVRNIEGFSRFFFLAAASNSHFLDLSKLSSEAAVPRQTATRYFEMLEDTLIVNRCAPFARSDRKRLLQHPKFFFFDTGVLNAALGSFELSSDRVGMLLETFLFNQILHSAQAFDEEIRISSYRTEHGAEVDFIVECEKGIFAIEVKASTNVGKSDLTGLESFSNYYQKPHRSIIAYLGETRKRIDRVSVIPWRDLFAELGFGGRS